MNAFGIFKSSLLLLIASVWIPLFCYGILTYLEGIQQQIDGTRMNNSFNYEESGIMLMKFSAAHGFMILLLMGYKIFLKRPVSEK